MNDTPQNPSSEVFVHRKSAHISICCDKELQVEGNHTSFKQLSFLHHSLPEIDYDNISIAQSFLGQELKAPFMISCMTGGSDDGYKLNKILAMTAQAEGIAVGTGSLRILLHRPDVIEHFRLKDLAPDIPVLGNIGAVQLPELLDGGGFSRLIRLINELYFDALVVHLNPGQEVFQEDGDRDFSGLIDHIARLCDVCNLPIIVKETGAGIAPWEAASLFQVGVRYVDLAGAGGTNWMLVESLRSNLSVQHAQESTNFSDWGIPTALALSVAVSHCRELGVIPTDGGFIASGGLRSAGDYAKAIALGADLGAAALPLIRLAREQGIAGCREYLDILKRGLMRHMFLSSSQNIVELQDAPLIMTNQFQHQRQVLKTSSVQAYQRYIRNRSSNSNDTKSLESVLDDRRFFKYSIHERRRRIASLFNTDLFMASGHESHLLDIADAMIESAIGFMPVPLGIVRGCMIDGKKYYIPIAVEEPSVLAAANYAMGIISLNGGIQTDADSSLMNACIYLDVEYRSNWISIIQENEAAIQAKLSDLLASMTERGGGYRDLEVAWLPESYCLRVSLIIDVCDAMGANIMNSAAEAVSPLLEDITGGNKIMAVVSNQAERRTVTAKFSLPISSLRRGGYEGSVLAERLIQLYQIANEDPSRGITHNKGIMNGISSLALSTGNDTRAVEAAAHAWAARTGVYRSLSRYWIEDDVLKASLLLPLALGTVGGAVSCHPVAKLSLAIMGQPNANLLARLAAALGLAQNFAALSALATEGIQLGHMKLHARRQKYTT